MTEADAVERDARWKLARVFAVLIVPLLGAFSLLEPFGRDHGIHASIAYAARNGLTPYLDVYNIKPPLTTAVHALSQLIFGHSMVAIRALDLVFATATAVGLVEIGRKLGRQPVFGFAVALAFPLFYYSYGYWDRAQTDGWAAFLVVPSLLLMLRGWESEAGRGRFLSFAWSGVLLGVAFAIKPTIGAMGALVFAPALANRFGTNDRNYSWSDFLACTAGGAVFLLVIIVAMMATGALEPFFEIQGFNRGYMALSHQVHFSLLEELSLINMYSKHLVLVVALGVVLMFASREQRRASLIISIGLIWTLAGWLSGRVQGKGFPYHYLPLVPAYALWFALAMEGVARFTERIRVQKLLGAVLVGAIFLATPVFQMTGLAMSLIGEANPASILRRQIPVRQDFNIVANVEFAEILKERREPGDSLFVWGYASMIYFLAEEPPRYRYPYSWPFMGNFYDGRYTDDLLGRLKENPPDQFVVQDHDATPWVTGNPRSSAQMLPAYPELQAFVDENYRLVGVHTYFSLYELNAE